MNTWKKAKSWLGAAVLLSMVLLAGTVALAAAGMINADNILGLGSSSDSYQMKIQKVLLSRPDAADTHDYEFRVTGTINQTTMREDGSLNYKPIKVDKIFKATGSDTIPLATAEGVSFAVSTLKIEETEESAKLNGYKWTKASNVMVKIPHMSTQVTITGTTLTITNNKEETIEFHVSGPNGYHEHFDISETKQLTGLTPGTYTISTPETNTIDGQPAYNENPPTDKCFDYSEKGFESKVKKAFRIEAEGNIIIPGDGPKNQYYHDYDEWPNGIAAEVFTFSIPKDAGPDDEVTLTVSMRDKDGNPAGGLNKEYIFWSTSLGKDMGNPALSLHAGETGTIRLSASAEPPEGALSLLPGAECKLMAYEIVQSKARFTLEYEGNSFPFCRHTPAEWGAGVVITNDYKTNMTVEKKWEGVAPENIPDKITATLYRDNSEVTDSAVELNAANGWKYTWDDLPVSSSDGTLYDYSVQETHTGGQFIPVYDEPIVLGEKDKNIFHITNVPANTLLVQKIVREDITGNEVDGGPYEFSVKLTDGSGVPLTQVRFNGETVTLTDGTHTFQLSNRESAVYTELTAGTKYEVTETGPDAVNPVYSSTVTKDDGSSESKTEEPDSRIGAIEGNTVVQVVVTNSKEPLRSLSVRKDWKGDESVAGLRPESIQVQLTQNGVPYGDPATLTAADNWFHKWENLPLKDSTGKDYTYAVEEPVVPEGYIVSYSRDDITLDLTDGKNHITITNTYPTGSLTIEKTVSGGGSAAAGKVYTFKVTGPSYPEGLEVEITGEGSKTLNGLRPGSYTVTEMNADIEGYTWTANISNDGSAEVEADKTASVTAANTYTEIKPNTGNLTIKKTVKVFNADMTEEDRTTDFTFTVSLKDGSGNPLPGTYPYAGAKSGTIADGGTVTLRHNQSVTVTDLPVGTQYKVTETVNDSYNNPETTVQKNEAEPVTGTQADGTITADTTDTVAFVNARTAKTPPPPTGGGKGRITIVKTVKGLPDEELSKLKLTITVDGPSYHKEVELSSGNNWRWSSPDLEDGTYRIKELKEDAGVDGYTLNVSGGEQSVAMRGSDRDVKITNTYTKQEPGTGSLTIVKTVSGGGEEAAGKTFAFTVTGPEGYNQTVTIVGAGSSTLTGLKPGTYTVTEGDAAVDGFVHTVSISDNGSAEVEADKTASITVANTYTVPGTGSLTIVKTVSGGGEEAAGKTFAFTVTGPEGYNQTVTIVGAGSNTLTGLKPGTYTVTEADAGIEGYTWTASISNGGAASVEADKTVSVTAANTYTESGFGSLTIVKTVSGAGETAANKIFAFTVTGPNGYSQTVTIAGSGSETLTNLEPGEYTVTEGDAGIDGYMWNVSITNGGAASVEVGRTASVTVSNTYETPPDPNKPGSPDTVTIYEDGVPKTYHKHWDPEKEEYEYIPEDQIPLGDMTPRTGDESKTTLWAALALMSLGGMGLVVLSRRKKKD